MSASQSPLILVTGGTRGLGLAMTTRLAGEGYRIVATGRKPSEALEALVSEHSEVAFRALDLGDHANLHSFCVELKNEFGPLYGLVNNGAVAKEGVLATQHESEIAEVVNVNLLGTLLLTKYALRAMFASDRGRIINIASIIAHTGYNGLSVYGASKAALLGFTRSLAREVGRIGVTVNSVSPGYMETEMSAGLDAEALAKIRHRSPLGELTQVEDVAAAVGFLLSDEAQRITGIDLKVDAGLTS